MKKREGSLDSHQGWRKLATPPSERLRPAEQLADPVPREARDFGPERKRSRKGALAHSVKVTAEPDVSSTVLRKVPIRDLIAFGLRVAMFREGPEGQDGELRMLVGPGGIGVDDAAIAAIKKLVGYVDEDALDRDDVVVEIAGKA